MSSDNKFSQFCGVTVPVTAGGGGVDKGIIFFLMRNLFLRCAKI